MLQSFDLVVKQTHEHFTASQLEIARVILETRYAVNFLESGYIHVFGNSYFQSFRGYRGFEVFPSAKLTKEEYGILRKVLSSLE